MPAANATALFTPPSGKTAKAASASKPPSFGLNLADCRTTRKRSQPSVNGPIEGATNGSAADPSISGVVRHRRALLLGQHHDVSRSSCAASRSRRKAVVVARLQRHHPHPEHCFVADIDIVLARECQLAVITNTEHRQARRYYPYHIAIPHIHRQIVLRHQ